MKEPYKPVRVTTAKEVQVGGTGNGVAAQIMCSLDTSSPVGSWTLLRKEKTSDLG